MKKNKKKKKKKRVEQNETSIFTYPPKSGPTDVTRGVVRLFRGLGIAMCWTSFVNAVYHNIVLTYTLFYLYSVSHC